MKITPSPKRIEFERILKKLGYKDRSPVIPPRGPLYEDILKCLNKNQVEIKGFITEYKNKKSYLYEFFIKNYNNFSKKEMRDKLKILCDDIIFSEKTRIGEIGWRIENMRNILFWNKTDRLEIYRSVIKLGKISIKYGGLGIKPNPGDILVSKPEGGKSTFFHIKAIKYGSSQRGRINRKFGFGEVKFNNTQYGRYNENLELIPI